MPAPDARPLTLSSQVALATACVAALETSAYGPFEVHTDEAAGTDPDAGGCDAVLVAAEPTESGRLRVARAAGGAALLVVVDVLEPSVVLAWLRDGAQDVLQADELGAPALPMRVRAAIERQRAAREARTAYATDLDTGLPHQQQLIEHMSQLLALREREPAPMALLVLRIEGLATTAARLGREASNVLRRKLGVRLRAGVRASDVVAALGDDRFAVLLGSLLAPADAARVGEKLLKALMAPLRVAGHDVTVATALGIAQSPQDGAQPDALLRRAVGLAASATAQGRAGWSNFAESGGQAPAAANAN